MFFDNVTIRLYFDMFELRTEITIQIGHFLVTFVCNQKMTKKYVIITSFVSWKFTLTNWQRIVVNLVVTLFSI